MTDTIFALSSGAPPAAIAVVRISGPAALDALGTLAGTPPPPRRLSLRTLRDPASGEVLDHALVTHFPADTSVTGEPLAELHVHGGRAVVASVLAALSRMPGLTQAKAGQFTWKAFHNGRMNLLQAEGLSGLLRAETEDQRRAALAGEGLSRQIEDWRQRLLVISAHVEAALDQSDEDDVPGDSTIPERLAGELLAEIGDLLARPGAERLFDGVRVVFAGPPNAGKSTLMNRLAGRDVAITSPVPGTTRDIVEAPVVIDGIAFVLTDTAGLRSETDDTIEAEGIARASARIAAADLLIWMDDGPPPLLDHDRVVAIHARADERPNQIFANRLPVSAVTGQGISALVDRLTARARDLLPREGEASLLKRQREHVNELHTELGGFVASSDDLISAEHLRRARLSLDRLTGRVGVDDLLDTLFGTFCLGK